MPDKQAVLKQTERMDKGCCQHPGLSRVIIKNDKQENGNNKGIMNWF